MVRENAKSISEKSGNFSTIAYILCKDNLSEIDASTSKTFNITILESSKKSQKRLLVTLFMDRKVSLIQFQLISIKNCRSPIQCSIITSPEL